MIAHLNRGVASPVNSASVRSGSGSGNLLSGLRSVFR